jgi:hypothetical protein
MLIGIAIFTPTQISYSTDILQNRYLFLSLTGSHSPSILMEQGLSFLGWGGLRGVGAEGRVEEYI